MKLIRFSDADVVRNPLVTRIVRAYDSFERQGAKRAGSKAPGAGS